MIIYRREEIAENITNELLENNVLNMIDYGNNEELVKVVESIVLNNLKDYKLMQGIVI